VGAKAWAWAMVGRMGRWEKGGGEGWVAKKKEWKSG